MGLATAASVLADLTVFAKSAESTQHRALPTKGASVMLDSKASRQVAVPWLHVVSLCKDVGWAAVSSVPCSPLFLLSASLSFGDCMLNIDLNCLFPRGKKLQQGCNGSFLAKLLLEASTFGALQEGPNLSQPSGCIKEASASL